MCFKKRAVKKSTATARKKIFIKFLNAYFMENQIKLGDVVTLKSEPKVKMTVGAYGGDRNGDTFACFYFLNGEIREFTIHKEALVKVS